MLSELFKMQNQQMETFNKGCNVDERSIISEASNDVIDNFMEKTESVEINLDEFKNETTVIEPDLKFIKSHALESIRQSNLEKYPEPIMKGEPTTIFGEERSIPGLEVEYKQISDAPLPETELTMDEKIDKQNQAIESVESGEKSLETTQEKGNYGEMKTDQDLRERGYERISTDMVTDLDDAGHQGIDGVYYNPDGDPQYVIVDAKYGTAQLSETADGKQMSENWIDKRLDEAVGKERADEIRLEKLLDSDNVGSYIAHVGEDGTVTYDRLDENANVIEKDVKL